MKAGLRFLHVLALALLLLCALWPVLQVLLLAVSPQAGFSSPFSVLRDGVTSRHFVAFFSTTDDAGRWLFPRQLANSLIVAVCTSVVGLVLSVTAAYALSRYRFLGRQGLLSGLIVTQMFPGTMMVVPLFFVLDALGLLHTTAGLVLVYATGAVPFCVWMLKGHFDAIPIDIDHAALLDGAPLRTVLWRIILPLARPGLAVTALFSFLTAWNEFVLAATFLSSDATLTLPVVLYRHIGSHSANWGAFAAGSIIVSIPVCVLFFILQRHMVAGLRAGSIK